MKKINLSAKTTISVTEDDVINLRCLAEYKESNADVLRRITRAYAGWAKIDLDEKRRILLNGRNP